MSFLGLTISIEFLIRDLIQKPIVSKLTNKLEDILVEMVDKVLKIFMKYL